MDNNNIDMAKLMTMLSKMDKKDLEQGINKLNQIISNEDKGKILKQFQKGN